MNLVLFITVLVISFIIVRIGAIAFQMTGLEWTLAKFQALSCFTSTGFTTKEAELITGNPQRRKIASVLIVLGHAGLVTMVATFANSLRPKAFKIPFISFKIPEFALLVLNLLIIVTALYILYRIVTNIRFASRITGYLRKKFIVRKIMRPVSCEELVLATSGFGVARIAVSEDSWIVGKRLAEAKLREHNINVLALIRNDETMPNPAVDIEFKSGDELLCFGKLDSIRQELMKS
jgi:hypothetical protein